MASTGLAGGRRDQGSLPGHRAGGRKEGSGAPYQGTAFFSWLARVYALAMARAVCAQRWQRCVRAVLQGRARSIQSKERKRDYRAEERVTTIGGASGPKRTSCSDRWRAKTNLPDRLELECAQHVLDALVELPLRRQQLPDLAQVARKSPSIVLLAAQLLGQPFGGR